VNSVSTAWKAYRGEPLPTRVHVGVRVLTCPFGPLIQRFPASGKALDVGCGHGLLINLLSRDPFHCRLELHGIDHDAAKINAAVLPGILREKKEAWEKGLVEFDKAVTAYNAAAAGNDDQALLDAAENLHAQFEMMVRVIRPVAKEVDAYHKVLYVVYHKYLPEKKYAEINSVAADMVAKAEAVTKAVLSPRLAAKTEAFQAAAAKLLVETKLLEAAGKAGLEKDIPSLVEKVHGAYMDLQKVFE